MSSLSPLNRCLRWLGTNHGIPLPGSFPTGEFERVQQCVCPSSFSRFVYCLLIARTGILSHPWMVVPQPSPTDGPPPDGVDIQPPWTAEFQSDETTTKPKTIVVPAVQLRPSHPPAPAQSSTSITSSDLPTPTERRPTSYPDDIDT